MTALALAPFRADMVLMDQASVLVWVQVQMWIHIVGWRARVIVKGWDAKDVL